MDKPLINARSTWGAQPPKGGSSYHANTLEDLAKVYTKITVHHDAQWADPNMTVAESKLRLRSHQQQHFNQGWADIGYHYLIDPQGNIFAGRSVFSPGAHVEGVNHGNLGISVMGAYHQQSLPLKAEEALVNLLAYFVQTFDISPDAIYGHRDFNATECPGALLYSRLPVIRSKVRKRLGEVEHSPDSVEGAPENPKLLMEEEEVQSAARLKVFSHSNKVTVLDEGRRKESVSISIKVSPKGITVSVDGKQVKDMKALNFELVRESQS